MSDLHRIPVLHSDGEDTCPACGERPEAALAELRGRTCKTCAYGNRGADPEFGIPAESGMNCRVLGGHILPCRVFGNTCGAWAAKEQA
jgi:hypothetical protein